MHDPGRGRDGSLHGGIVLLCLCVLWISAACGTPDRPPERGPDLPAGVACREVVLDVLRSWGANAAPRVAPPPVAGGRSLRFPTSTIGAWVIVEAPPVGPPLVALSTPTEVTARLYDLSCRWEERSVPRSSAASGDGPTFTDADLRTVIDASEGRTVVVYAWAPHMPLSVDGYPEIAEAASALGAELVPLLIGHSDLGFARREAGRVGMPSHGLREIDSNELVMRDLQVHAPSILVFAADRTFPVLPGYRDADGYRRYFQGLPQADLR